MAAYLDGKRWRYQSRVMLPDGKMIRISGSAPKLSNTKSSAQGAERMHIARVLGAKEESSLQRKEQEQKVVCPTVAEFAGLYIAASMVSNKPSSVESKEHVLKKHLVPFFGALRLDQVTYAKIEDFKIDQVRKRLSAKTVNNHLTVLRRMLVIARKRGLVAVVPEVEWLRTEKGDPDFLTFDEGERLIGGADGEWFSMILVAMRTGLRQGELLGLRWEDVDLVKGEIKVRQNIVRGRIGTPKSGKGREVPLTDQALAALKAQRHLRGPYVWCDADGRVLKKGACKHPLWRACRRAGLRRISWHVLRHTYASHLVMRGVPLKVVQELLGHSTIQMTMRYAHLSPDSKGRAVVNVLDAAATTSATANFAQNLPKLG